MGLLLSSWNLPGTLLAFLGCFTAVPLASRCDDVGETLPLIAGRALTGPY
jgi:hypothetical protein